MYTATISPHDIVNGYLRFKIVGISFTPFYMERRQKYDDTGAPVPTKVVAASAVGMAYLLAFPSMIISGQGKTAIFWFMQEFGKHYYEGVVAGFYHGPTIPVESYCIHLNNPRERLGYEHGFECHRLLLEQNIDILSGSLGPEAMSAMYEKCKQEVLPQETADRTSGQLVSGPAEENQGT